MNFDINKILNDLIEDWMIGVEILGKQVNYVLCTPGLNILFWLIMVELLLALVFNDLSNHHTINYF